MNSYFLGLGGNLGESETLFLRAIEAMNSGLGEVISCSRVYASPPLPLPDGGSIEQNDFKNIVLELRSELEPLDLLQSLLAIEEDNGRVRGEETLRWGPRPIDIDIVACGDRVVSEGSLRIPHAEMHRRLFVLLPLSEISPDWVHPVKNLGLPELIKAQEGSMPCKALGPLLPREYE